ncbi:MAG: hypothetical protein KAJ19_13460 [Gammaproteobacteria bacterium]|nr:hypothetical protein [Gammaproteobacteria bacterium]
MPICTLQSKARGRVAVAQVGERITYIATKRQRKQSPYKAAHTLLARLGFTVRTGNVRRSKITLKESMTWA